MTVEEREVGIGDLRVGMFVCRLDRPWSDTPFPLEGFLVHDREQLGVLLEYCSRVWIDVDRSQPDVRESLRSLRPPPARPRVAESAPLFDPALTAHRYVDTVTFDEERPAALIVLEDARRITARIVDDIHAGRVLSSADVRAAAEPIVASVLRNADALFWVNALRERDAYAYSHAINCSALAAAFGRHLGMPHDVLIQLACGALLLDIGKTRVPDEIINHPGPLNPIAMARARRHVELGIQVLDESNTTDAVVREIVRSHHERYDGSGYPARLAGVQIPVFARVTGIIDSFDAMTSDRPYARAIPRHDALQELYRHRDTLYHGELVEQFISCLGVYPTGSLVELTTGEVAAVMAQHPSRRLRPRVMLLTDENKQLRAGFGSVDLMDQPLDAPRLEIRRPLSPGEFDIDLSDLYL